MTVTSGEIQAVQLVDDNLQKTGIPMINGKPRIISNPYYYEVAKGNVANHNPVHMVGLQTATKLNTHTDLNELGVDVTPIPTAATIMELISTSASDGVAGTGALTVFVEGLDASYNEISETVIMNGITAVATTGTYIRINHLYIATAGSVKAAVGTISFQTTGGGTEYSRISIGHTASQQSLYTVPAGYQAVILGGTSGGVVAKDLSIFYQTTQNNSGSVSDGIFYIADRIVLKDDSLNVPYSIPKIVTEKADIKVTCESLNNAGGYVTATVSFYIEPL